MCLDLVSNRAPPEELASICCLLLQGYGVTLEHTLKAFHDGGCSSTSFQPVPVRLFKLSHLIKRSLKTQNCCRKPRGE